MIIIIEKDQTFLNMLQINISSQLPIKILQKENASEAIAMMEVLPDVKIVICRAQTGKEETAKRLIESIKSEQSDTKLIVLEQTGNPPEKFVKYLESTSPVDKITKMVISLISNDGSEKAPPMVQRSYFTIPFSLLKLLDIYPTDFYIKIKKGDLNDYLKLFNANETVEFTKIDTYIEKGAKKAYVKKEDSSKTVEKINERFKKIISNSIEDLQDREQVESALIDNLSFLGVNKGTLKIAQQSANTLLNELNQNKKVTSIINAIYKKPGSLKYRKAFMTSLFAGIISKHESSIDSVMLKSLLTASFFNDLKLERNDHMVIRSEEEFNLALLSKSDAKIVDHHAAEAAEQLSKLNDISEETIKIIRQHHGVNTGNGYTYSLQPTITILSQIFILSEELSIRILCAQSSDINLSRMLKEISLAYGEKLDRFINHLKSSFSSK